MPLLNSGDESANELDDEVAMIAKKKGNELINIDEIKIEIKGSQSVKSKGNDNKTE